MASILPNHKQNKKICSSFRQRPRNWNATLRLTNTQVLGSCDNRSCITGHMGLVCCQAPRMIAMWACEKKKNQDNSWLAYRTDLGIYGWGDKRNYSELIIILSLWIVYVILNHVSTLSRLSAFGLYWKNLTIALTRLNGSPTFEWNFCAPRLVRCAKHLTWCMDVSVTTLVILAALSVDTAMDLCRAAGTTCSAWSWCECISWSVWSSSLPAVYRVYENYSHSI